MTEDVKFYVGKADRFGKRLVSASRNGREVARDSFDTNNAALRTTFLKQFRSQGSFGDGPDYERALLTAADQQDENALAQLEDGDSEPLSTPTLVCMKDVKAEKIEWLYPGKLAFGKFSIVGGDPGDGKSTMLLTISALFTRGEKMPCAEYSAGSGSVVWLCCEDGYGDTVRPRLDAAMADVSKIWMLPAVKNPDDSKRPFSLEVDLPALELAVDQTAAKLVVIDPISEYMGKHCDAHNNADVRRVLMPLIELAERRKICVVGIHHTNKSNNAKAIHRMMGSVGFVAAARTVFALVRDKEDASRRLLLCCKNNIAKDTAGLAFSLMDNGAGAPVVAWEAEPVTGRADELLGEERQPKDRNGAIAWLKELLSNGEMRVSEIEAEGKEVGYTKRQLDRVKDKLGIVPRKVVRAWWWGLPGQDTNQDDHQPHTRSLGNHGHLKEREEEDYQDDHRSESGGNGHLNGHLPNQHAGTMEFMQS